MTKPTRSSELRRQLYRRSRRVLVRLLVGRLPGRRPDLERAARGFLRDRSLSYLAEVVVDRRSALAAVAALVASTTATALPPVNLSDVAAGTGGFVINGINPDDEAGRSVSGAGDVNGDGLADLMVGAVLGDPGGNGNAGESYVIFAPSCPWDCGDGDGQVGILDFLAMLADWGGQGACDFDGGGIGITDFLDLLAHWGTCP